MTPTLLDTQLGGATALLLLLLLYSTQICGDMNVGGDGGRMKIVVA